MAENNTDEVIKYLNMDINERVRIIKTQALNNKQLLRNFLEGFLIDNKPINDYITFYMLNVIEANVNPNYTYWMDSGLTWSLWYNGLLKNLTDEQYKSITTGYFKFHYIITNKDTLQDRIKTLYDFTIQLRDKINENLMILGLNFETDIKLINIKEDITLEFINDAKQLFKEPSCNIRLIIKKKVSAGARIKKRGHNKLNFFKSQGTYGLMARVMEKINMDEFNIIPDNFNSLNDDTFNNKIILDFHLEIFYQTLTRQLNIEEYKNYYLEPQPVGNKNYEDGINKKLLNREKLNRLNETGMITYCLLNLSAIDDEFGINVDKYRQKLFLDNKKNIPRFFEDLLNKYNLLFEKFKSHNAFFIDKINEIINFHKNKYFESFKDFIDKWFVSKFRPYINSFIVEINKELFDNYGVVLFIAGGDAMRRFKNDISFTKDIDTKLYIGNVTETSIKNEEIKRMIQQERIIKGDLFDVKLFIKDCIVGVITKHIVKLRNFLEEKIKHIFYDILQYDKRDFDNGFGTKVLSFKTSNSIYYVDILLDKDNKNKFQQFRTRENKKRVDFPVDLYSIDFRTFIGEYDIETNKLIGKKKAHDISILDVVLQDVDNFHEDYINYFDGIPVASLKFLLEDFYKTYTTPDRALARISSDKVKKDIIRFNEIKSLFRNIGKLFDSDNGILFIPDLNKIIRNLVINKDKFKKGVYKILLAFLIKIKNKTPINITDINAIISIYMDKVFQMFINKHQVLNIAISDMIFFKKNLYNENLNKSEQTYIDYHIDDDEIRQGYYELFSKLCSINNKDGLVRHVIMFSNTKIKTAFKDIGIIYKPLLPKPRAPPKKKTSVISASKSKGKKIVIQVNPTPLSSSSNSPTNPTPQFVLSSRGRAVKVKNYNEKITRGKILPQIPSGTQTSIPVLLPSGTQTYPLPSQPPPPLPSQPYPQPPSQPYPPLPLEQPPPLPSQPYPQPPSQPPPPLPSQPYPQPPSQPYPLPSQPLPLKLKRSHSKID